MANDINRVFMVARLTKDPELRYTQGGTSIASFSVANNKSWMQNNEKKESVSFFNCIAWGKPGEVIVQYCKKGQRIGIEGRLQQRSWQDQNGGKRSTVEIVVENFQFLSAGAGQQSNDNGDPGPHAQTYPDDPDSVPMSSDFSDESIPF